MPCDVLDLTMRRRKSRGVCVLLRRGGLAALLFWNQLGSATSDSAARQAGPFGLKTATRGGSSGSHGAQDSVLRSISKGEAVTYPDPEYTEGANEAFAPSGRDGMKMKSKSCVHCMMFNSKQKVAKKYSDIMKDAMGGSMRDARADAIGKQMTRQDTASMRDRTGDSSYGNGADSDIDRRRKDAAEKKCLDEPVAKQPACLRKAKAMEPGIYPCCLSLRCACLVWAAGLVIFHAVVHVAYLCIQNLSLTMTTDLQRCDLLTRTR